MIIATIVTVLIAGVWIGSLILDADARDCRRRAEGK